MRIAVDALSITNFSGRRVLMGHLANLAARGGKGHQLLVLHHRGNRDLRRDLGPNVEWLECAGAGTGWARRLLWQSFELDRLLREHKAQLLISTSGSLLPMVSIPQVVLAMNPWCFWPQFHRSVVDRAKAWLQRHGYRRAQREAAAVFCLSDYLASEYHGNAGQAPLAGKTMYTGVDDGAFAKQDAPPAFEQRECQVVTVSVMARHKAIEDVVDAVAALHARGVTAKLTLAGPWPDAGYRSEIEGRIAAADLGAFVTITGETSVESLIAHYRAARVFCLLSRCESFGIPAVEAQLHGTPTVVANTCAPPEVAGPGGEIVPPGDIEAAADALARLLTDPVAWREASARALANTGRFRWSQVSAPLVEFLDGIEVAA